MRIKFKVDVISGTKSEIKKGGLLEAERVRQSVIRICIPMTTDPTSLEI